MRTLKLILFLAIISCTSKVVEINDSPANWSETEKRQYFIDSIAYRNFNGRYTNLNHWLNSADTFFLKAYNIKSEWYSNTEIIYALEEEFIDTNDFDLNTNFLRITVNPTFQIPYGIILKQTKSSTNLIGKMTDGQGGYHSGYLDLSVSKKVNSEFANQIFSRLEKLDFYNLPSNIEVNGADGESWRIELIKNGKYHSITRWTPNHVGDSITREIGNLGIELRDTSKLFEYWTMQSDSSKA